MGLHGRRSFLGQTYSHGRALPLLACDLDVAGMGSHDVARDREAEPETAVVPGRHAAHVRLEDPGQDRWWDADAPIAADELRDAGIVAKIDVDRVTGAE